MTKKISQIEARRLRKRVKELENFFQSTYSGTRIQTWTLTDAGFSAVQTADALGYHLILRQTHSGVANEVKVAAVRV